MRKGNKTRLIVALLTAALMLNAVAFAQVDGVETEFELIEVPNSLEETAEPVADDQVAEAQAALMAAVEEGQVVEPGKVIAYNGKSYRIKDGATNVMAAMGGFDSKPNIVGSGEADVVICDDAWNYNTEDGHNAPGCLEIMAGHFIWRHYFEQDKIYVYSAWWKFKGDINLDDSQRHIEGCYDVDSGSSHVNEIGRNRDITYDWQQDLCVFRGNSAERRFLYVTPTGSGSILADDLAVYEVEVIDSLQIGNTVIEEPNTWDTYNEIPQAGTNYNCVISYTVNVTEPIHFNGVLIMFKDGKLYNIVQREVNSRTATLIDGDLTPASGTVSIPFKVPEGEDVSDFSCTAYLSEPGNPFYVYGAASTSYAATISGANQ